MSDDSRQRLSAWLGWSAVNRVALHAAAAGLVAELISNGSSYTVRTVCILSRDIYFHE